MCLSSPVNYHTVYYTNKLIVHISLAILEISLQIVWAAYVMHACSTYCTRTLASFSTPHTHTCLLSPRREFPHPPGATLQRRNRYRSRANCGLFGAPRTTPSQPRMGGAEPCVQQSAVSLYEGRHDDHCPPLGDFPSRIASRVRAPLAFANPIG